MGHGKESPRQKMIGMMYLVLTALLAMNVSKDVLDAFVIVDEGLEKTAKNFSQKNETVYGEFAEKYIQNETKVGPWKDKAESVKAKCDEVYNLIEELKIEIVKTSEGEETPAIDEKGHINSMLINAKDNSDIPAQVMIGDNNNGKAQDLKVKYDELRNFLIDNIVPEDNESLRESIMESLSTENPPKTKDGMHRTWESEHFAHLPLIAVITIMSKMQTDIRNVEADITRYLFNQIDAGDFTVNKLEPTVIPNSNYIIKGNPYQADVFLAAFDTTQQPIVYVGKYEQSTREDGGIDYKMIGKYDSLKVVNGKGKYEAPSTSAIGNKTWGGLIKLRAPDGSFIYRPFESEYQVAEPNLVVSPTKMNVFYIGVDNPVSISVAGVPADKITATMTNGSLKKVRKGYVAKPRRPGNSLITVQAEVHGTKKKMGTVEFRVKKVQDPVAFVAGKKGGKVSKQILLSQQGLVAEIENFEFDMKFKVTQFTVSAVIKGFVQDYRSQNNKFTAQQKSLMKSLRRGQKLFIIDIKAVGPDKIVRDLSPMNFKID